MSLTEAHWQWQHQVQVPVPAPAVASCFDCQHEFQDSVKSLSDRPSVADTILNHPRTLFSLLSSLFFSILSLSPSPEHTLSHVVWLAALISSPPQRLRQYLCCSSRGIPPQPSLPEFAQRPHHLAIQHSVLSLLAQRAPTNILPSTLFDHPTTPRIYHFVYTSKWNITTVPLPYPVAFQPHSSPTTTPTPKRKSEILQSAVCRLPSLCARSSRLA
jgi:hypothetical protein